MPNVVGACYLVDTSPRGQDRTAERAPWQPAEARLSAPDFVVRAMLSGDKPFIADAWVQTHRASSFATKHAEKESFFRHHHRNVDRILSAPGLEVRVAAPENDDVTIYGFVVLGPGLIHFAYVKKPLRRFGIAKRLLQGVDINASRFDYWSQDVFWIREKFPKLRYDPYPMEAA